MKPMQGIQCVLDYPATCKQVSGAYVLVCVHHMSEYSGEVCIRGSPCDVKEMVGFTCKEEIKVYHRIKRGK